MSPARMDSTSLNHVTPSRMFSFSVENSGRRFLFTSLAWKSVPGLLAPRTRPSPTVWNGCRGQQMRMERYSAARKSLERARTIRELNADSKPLRRAHLLELFAWLDRYTGNYESARIYSEALRHSEGGCRGDDSLSIDSAELDGDLRAARRKRRRGAAPVVGHHAADRERFRPDHPVVAALERRLAFASDAVGNRQEATRHLARGLDIARVAARARVAPSAWPCRTLPEPL